MITVNVCVSHDGEFSDVVTVGFHEFDDALRFDFCITRMIMVADAQTISSTVRDERIILVVSIGDEPFEVWKNCILAASFEALQAMAEVDGE